MTIRNPSYSAGMFWIVATAALWSFLGLIGKFCLAQGMPPMQCAFWRCVFGGAAFFLHCAFTGSLRIPVRHALLFMLFGIWGIGGLPGLYNCDWRRFGRNANDWGQRRDYRDLGRWIDFVFDWMDRKLYVFAWG